MTGCTWPFARISGTGVKMIIMFLRLISAFSASDTVGFKQAVIPPRFILIPAGDGI